MRGSGRFGKKQCPAKISSKHFQEGDYRDIRSDGNAYRASKSGGYCTVILARMSIVHIERSTTSTAESRRRFEAQVLQEQVDQFFESDQVKSLLGPPNFASKFPVPSTRLNPKVCLQPPVLSTRLNPDFQLQTSVTVDAIEPQFSTPNLGCR